MSDRIESYQQAFKDDQQRSLDAFLRSMAKFDRAFCEAMAEGVDFTLSLEVRGDKGQLLHSRVKTDQFARPDEKQKNLPKQV